MHFIAFLIWSCLRMLLKGILRQWQLWSCCPAKPQDISRDAVEAPTFNEIILRSRDSLILILVICRLGSLARSPNNLIISYQVLPSKSSKSLFLILVCEELHSKCRAFLAFFFGGASSSSSESKVCFFPVDSTIVPFLAAFPSALIPPFLPLPLPLSPFFPFPFPSLPFPSFPFPFPPSLALFT